MISGTTLARWARLAASALEREREEINRLNVFPIPDSDTGSNMAQTMAAAVDALDDLGSNPTAQQVASALAAGAVKGARGNSGVVLSQVLRGIAQASGEEVSATDFISALTQAVGLVERAIQDPVEGTVLTVLRAAAQAAEAEPDDPVHAACAAATVALAETPSQLPILAERGVVDAGGKGLVVTLNALVDALAGSDTEVSRGSHTAGALLEVMFYLRATHQDQFNAIVDALVGESLTVARDSDRSGTVHIHTRQAGELIETVFAQGEVSRLHIEPLPDARTLLVVPDEVAELFPVAQPLSAMTPGTPGTCVFITCGLTTSSSVHLGAECAVVETDTVVAGFAAASMHEEHLSPAEDAAAMRRAVADVTAVSLPRDAAESFVQDQVDRLVNETTELVTVIGPEAMSSAITVPDGVELVHVNSSTVCEVGVE